MARKKDTERTAVPLHNPALQSKESVEISPKAKSYSSNTMPCPVPGHNGMAEVFRVPGRTYAVCHCPGKTKHYGQVVWEQT
jgi:hypothetical protein